MIVYAFVNFEHYSDERLYHLYLQGIPPPIRQQVLRHRKTQDRNNCLFGKLLLRDLLVQCFDQSPACLNDIAYNEYGKPFLNDTLHFNISHSHEIVMCAISNEGVIGVDLEFKRPIELDDLESCLRQDEYKLLQQSDDRDAIYTLWTQKESVLKALGTGLMTDLKDIYLYGSKALVYNGELRPQQWHLQHLHVHKDYSTTICTAKPIDHIIQVQLDSYRMDQLKEAELSTAA